MALENISKQGIWSGELIEPFITLSDGSNWQLLMFHYVDGGNNLFTQANATDCNEWGLYSRLKWVNDFTYNSKYEFYVLQDGKEYRWTQTSQPTASSIAGFTAVTGTPYVGLAKGSHGKAYLGYNTWWGACGCWTSYTQSGVTGIPGFGGNAAANVCTKYLALYARIEKPILFIEDDSTFANQFYEY